MLISSTAKAEFEATQSRPCLRSSSSDSHAVPCASQEGRAMRALIQNDAVRHGLPELSLGVITRQPEIAPSLMVGSISSTPARTSRDATVPRRGKHRKGATGAQYRIDPHDDVVPVEKSSHARSRIKHAQCRSCTRYSGTVEPSVVRWRRSRTRRGRVVRRSPGLYWRRLTRPPATHLPAHERGRRSPLNEALGAILRNRVALRSHPRRRPPAR
jgi:hypothetical protein